MIADATPMAADKGEGRMAVRIVHGVDRQGRRKSIFHFIGGHRRGIGDHRRFQRLFPG
jgi:hypothetical protein